MMRNSSNIKNYAELSFSLQLLKITSGCLDIFKEVLLTESMYNHDLEFLMTVSIECCDIIDDKYVVSVMTLCPAFYHVIYPPIKIRLIQS
ncbi:unnamed protein product [Schistosoma curassoni]|uniref:DH domain-containing protein n=1 Tax=Schistosoma curassoni TaxID=6186 RepID=A0A183KZI4_9TREM|nr:unnamed protein product [Schistosoma curassoni]